MRGCEGPVLHGSAEEASWREGEGVEKDTMGFVWRGGMKDEGGGLWGGRWALV